MTSFSLREDIPVRVGDEDEFGRVEDEDVTKDDVERAGSQVVGGVG